MAGEKGLCWRFLGPGGPSRDHVKERPGCAKWGLETKSISFLTVYLDGQKEEIMELKT